MAANLWGRSRELDRGTSALALAQTGLGCGFALVGEPGIGKTALATELSQRATGMGLSTFWGRAWESGGAPAYWPWRQLLEAMLPELRDASAGGPLSLIWSSHGIGEFSTSDPGQARFELFDAVVRVLREYAKTRPALCVLDDLHAADVASLELAGFALGALRSSPIAWVVTYRDAEAERLPVRDALVRLSRKCTVLPLQRLSREDSSSLVRQHLGQSGAELADSLFLATSGNPLFLCETVRALSDGRSRYAPLEQIPVSQGVAAVARDRCAVLSVNARSLMEVAVVLGREVSLELLTATTRQSPAAVRALANEVSTTGLWNEVQRDRWLFSHALVRDALYLDLSAEHRAALEAQVAETLDVLVLGGRGELAISRALHALEAGGRVAPARVVPWVLEASRAARSQLAFEESAGLLDRAMRELEVDDSARGELLLALGWAKGDLGDGAGLRRAFDEVIAIARRARKPVLLARAVLGRGSQYVLGNILTELISLIDDALEELPEDESDLKALLWARKASAMTPGAEPEPALKLARAALDAVKGSTDTRAVLNVAVAAGSALSDFAPPAERIQVNLGLVRAARRLSDRVLELRGLSRLVVDHIEAGDVAQADAVLLERDALASSLGHPRFRWMTPLFRSMRAMMEGRFDICETSVDEARRLIELSGEETAWRCLAVHQQGVLLLQDRVDALRATEPELLRRLQGMAGIPEFMRAMVLARGGGHMATARELLRRAGGTELHFLRSPKLLAGVGYTAVLCGDRELAEAAYRFLQPHAESSGTVGLFGLVSDVPIRATLGLLAAMLGQPEQACAHFDLALERTAAMGASAHEAWVRLWLGQALDAWGDDPAAARVELDAAAALARRLNMPGVEARARGERLGLAPKAVRPKEARGTQLDFALRRHGSGWRLERGRAVVVLKDLRGMAMLAKLLERPGEEIHSLELVTGEGDGDGPGEGRDAAVDGGDAGELLDEKARLAYRKRIEELSERIEDTEARGDEVSAERARGELEALSRELSRAVGLGGRARRAGSAAERSRTTAQRRLKEAIRRIAELDAEVGTFLERTIRTGTFCAFEPNRRERERG